MSLWTPLLSAAIAERWFSWPNIAFLSPVPLLVAALALGLLSRDRGPAGDLALRDRDPALPRLLCGAGVSLFPYVVPPSITIWDAAAPDESLAFLLVGTAVLIPIILAYTGYSYWVFRGKADSTHGYH